MPDSRRNRRGTRRLKGNDGGRKMSVIGDSSVIGFVKCNWMGAETVLAVTSVEAENLQLKFTGLMYWWYNGEEMCLGLYSVYGCFDSFEVKNEYARSVPTKDQA